MSQLCRSDAERLADPERYNFDGCELVACPLLKGEEQLRVLSLQSNRLTAIANLVGLPSLIFLDLCNNLLTHISGLDRLVSLRVLMLGRNRISRIEGLDFLHRLDVLDLHANQIGAMEHLGHLAHLRILNLADNELQALGGLGGLRLLTELNVRRNAIQHIAPDVGEAANLQRLFLSHNKLGSLECLRPLARLPRLLELALEGNGCSEQPHCSAAIEAALPKLRVLDGRPFERRPTRAPAQAPAAQRDGLAAAGSGGAIWAAAAGTLAAEAAAQPPPPPEGARSRHEPPAHAAPQPPPAALAASQPPTSASHISPTAASLAQERLRAIDRARAAYRAHRADLSARARGHVGASEDAWANVHAGVLHVCGNYAGPVGGMAAARRDEGGARAEGVRAPLSGALDGVRRAALSFMSYEHLSAHWLPRLQAMRSLSHLGLSDCGLDSLRQLYALLPRLRSLSQLDVGGEEAGPGPGAAGVHAHPMFRACVVSMLPLLVQLNGVPITEGERAVAEQRCAALNRLALGAGAPPGGPAASASPELAAMADDLASAVLGHALATDRKLRALDEVWPDALEAAMRETVAQRTSGAESSR